MRALLQSAVDGAGSQTAAARKLGVSVQYLSDCLKGRRPIGKSIAIPMGYEPVTVYVSTATKRPLYNGKRPKGALNAPDVS